jgi:hypothetical protein
LPLVGKFFGLARGKRHFKSKKEEGRRKKEEGRRKKEEKRRKREEGRFSHFRLFLSRTLPISDSLPLSLSHFLHLPIPDSRLSFGPGILF